MLAGADVLSLVPTSKPDQARAFYRDVLGLELVSEDSFAVVFAVNGRRLRLTKVPQGFTPQEFAIVGWQVTDVVGTVAELAARGVQFERYPFLDQDAYGIWTTPDGAARIAWFKDPDGNVLSVVGS